MGVWCESGSIYGGWWAVSDYFKRFDRGGAAYPSATRLRLLTYLQLLKRTSKRRHDWGNVGTANARGLGVGWAGGAVRGRRARARIHSRAHARGARCVRRRAWTMRGHARHARRGASSHCAGRGCNVNKTNNQRMDGERTSLAGHGRCVVVLVFEGHTGGCVRVTLHVFPRGAVRGRAPVVRPRERRAFDDFLAVLAPPVRVVIRHGAIWCWCFRPGGMSSLLGVDAGARKWAEGVPGVESRGRCGSATQSV